MHITNKLVNITEQFSLQREQINLHSEHISYTEINNFT